MADFFTSPSLTLVGIDFAASEPEPKEPPLPAVNPAWLAPLCDGYAKKEIYLWFKLVYDGMGDLDPQECGEDSEGGVPDWWDQEDDKSLGTLLSPEWTRTNHGGHEFTDQWLRWGLHEGIAPGQPFLVRFGKPHWYRCGSYGEEYDVEWDVEVVRVMPRTPAQALRAWDRTLGHVRRYYELFHKRRERLFRLQDTDTAAMSITTELYHASEARYYLDDMATPGGLRIHLCSKHSSMWGKSNPGSHVARLVSGESNKGNSTEAFRDLFKNVAKYRPRISLPTVIALAKGKAGVTRWEMLAWDLTDPV